MAETKERSSRDPFQINAYPDFELIYIETMWSILPLLSLSALLVPVQSLYFYIDGTSPKCFFEELPKDTLVVGKYVAEEYDENTKQWSKHDGLNIFITVDVCAVLLRRKPSFFSIRPFSEPCTNTKLTGGI